MSESTYRVQGTVVDSKEKRGIPGLRVEAWDKDLVFDDFLGTAVTDRAGQFGWEVKAAYFQKLFGDRHPDLYFKVFRGETLVASTEREVLWNAGQEERPIVIEIELPPAADGPLYLVETQTAIVLRKEPRADSDVVGRVPSRSLVAIIGSAGAWLHVSSEEDVTGFVRDLELPILAKALRFFAHEVPASVLNPAALAVVFEAIARNPLLDDARRAARKESVTRLAARIERAALNLDPEAQGVISPGFPTTENGHATGGGWHLDPRRRRHTPQATARRRSSTSASRPSATK